MNTSVPANLSSRSKRFWTILNHEYEFGLAELELLERALTAFDLADELQLQARKVGLTTPAGRGALSGSRDASTVALKYLLATGVTKADMEAAKRPGRPADAAWSKMRSAWA